MKGTLTPFQRWGQGFSIVLDNKTRTSITFVYAWTCRFQPLFLWMVPIEHRMSTINHHDEPRLELFFLERYEWIIEFAGSGNAEARN